jgi:dihydroorotase
MNRRQLLYLSTIIEKISRVSGAFAASTAKYDLIVKGGHVIDPSRGLNAVRDVGIVNRHIATVKADLEGASVETIDARGKLVLPGLIDIHTHFTRVSCRKATPWTSASPTWGPPERP